MYILYFVLYPQFRLYRKTLGSRMVEPVMLQDAVTGVLTSLTLASTGESQSLYVMRTLGDRSSLLHLDVSNNTMVGMETVLEELRGSYEYRGLTADDT